MFSLIEGSVFTQFGVRDDGEGICSAHSRSDVFIVSGCMQVSSFSHLHRESEPKCPSLGGLTV